MKYVIFGLFTVLFSTGAFATNAKVFSYSSTIKNSNQTFSCSATLIKHQGQCHLLTNNHCVENKTNFKISFLEQTELNATYADQFAMSKNAFSISVGLRNTNRRLDLAVLSFREGDLKNECESIEEVSESDYKNYVHTNWVRTFLAAGLVNQKPVMQYSSNIPWSTGYGASQVFYDYELGDGLYFVHVSDLDIIPGMSGSPVINNRGTFIGLTSKYVDFQSSVLVVPLPMILAVLENRVSDLPEMQLKKYHNNSQSDAGNEHAGAGNEHAGAGGSTRAGSLTSFRAPDEGIQIKNEIILGFMSKDGFFGKTYYHQIDGLDEYEMKVNDPYYMNELGLKGKITTFISRPVNGYPEVEVRKNILERMDGFYYMVTREKAGAQPFNQRYSFFAFNPNSARGLESIVSEGTALMIDLDSKKNKVNIESQYLNISFDVTYSADYKTIFLTSNNLRLTCDNKNLLKLICSNEALEFSVSVNHTASGRFLKYRFALRSTLNQIPGISYRFGTVMATDKVENWRNK